MAQNTTSVVLNGRHPTPKYDLVFPLLFLTRTVLQWGRVKCEEPLVVTGSLLEGSPGGPVLHAYVLF